MVMARTRLALALWIALAVVVWNVVFDQILVFAGRAYVEAAVVAAYAGGPYERIDVWMRPAVARAFMAATTLAVGILVPGLLAIHKARHRRAVVPAPERGDEASRV
jgi:hypothetical protein